MYILYNIQFTATLLSVILVMIAAPAIIFRITDMRDDDDLIPDHLKKLVKKAIIAVVVLSALAIVLPAR